MTTKKKYSCNILWMHNISRDANIQLLYTRRETKGCGKINRSTGLKTCTIYNPHFKKTLTMVHVNLTKVLLQTSDISWMHNIMSNILLHYTGRETHSKPKRMWKDKPEHWPLNKPFYDPKNKSQDEHGKSISNEDLLKCLLDCCKHKNVQINFLYQKEVDAWREQKHELLNKLYIFRRNTEKIKLAIQNMLFCKDFGEIRAALKNINVCLTMDKTETDFLKIRCKGQSELVTEITRNLATILCKIIKGKDPEAKCDGIWTSPPENWPPAVPFYSPHNRGKCKQTGSDKELVLTLIQNPKAIIPQKFQSLVTSFQKVVNASNSWEAKKHKETLCRIYTIQNNVSIIDNALQTMHEHGLFTLNIHSVLNQWWTKQTLDPQSDEILKNSAIISDNRQGIQIQITETSFKIGFKTNDLEDTSKSHVFYNITSQTQKSCPQKICSSSSKSSSINYQEKVNNDSVFPSFSKDQETLSKEQSKINCQTEEPRQTLSEDNRSGKDESVTENDSPSQATGKKRRHPADEKLQSGTKRPTLSTVKNYNTKTAEIIETQQSEQPLVGNHVNDNDESQDNNLGITYNELHSLLTSISTFSSQTNLDTLSNEDECFSDHQLELILTDMVDYESGKNSNTEELLSKGHDIL